jgi:glycosyltransferase involved in cell wall biosynthesis
MSVTLFNPLPVTLGHYQGALEQTLRRIGVSSGSVAPRPATDAQESHLTRGRAHLQAIRERPAGDQTLILWPAFGWLEPVVWGRGEASRLIVHDPTPIRGQYGYGRASRLLARLCLDFGALELICHTVAARDEVARRVGPRRQPMICLHPIAAPSAELDPAVPRKDRPPIVLVAGQYKPSRDVELLSELGPLLRDAALHPRIVGRGWPPLAGWDARDGFVSEADFELELRQASVLLVPYRRYWQSGVAVRALENGTEIVGGRTEFLATLLGEDHPGLIEGDPDARAWLAAIEATVDGSRRLDDRRLIYQNAADESWASLFERFI